MTDTEIVRELTYIKELLDLLLKRGTAKEYYGTDEFARIVGKAEFTVREHCRLGRINAEKKMSGRGAFPAWAISHQELLRYQREGLLAPKGLTRTRS